MGGVYSNSLLLGRTEKEAELGKETLTSQVLKVQIQNLKRQATDIFILLQLLLASLEKTKHGTQYFVKTCYRHIEWGFPSIHSCTIRKSHCLGVCIYVESIWGGLCRCVCMYTYVHTAIF